MLSHPGFLADIIEHPDDDTPRLVYADWLDDQGDSDRAEFIRVQCSLARMALDDSRRQALLEREKELLGEYGWIWAEEFGTDLSEWVYQRGFIERVGMCLETSSERILAVLQKAPIRHIRDTSQFCNLTGVVEALPHFGHLTGLEFWGLYAVEDSLLNTILESPHLSNLRTLILHHDSNGNMIEERVLVKAMNSQHRANLEELAVNVDGSWRGPSRKLLNAMSTSPYLRKLRKLNLSNAGDEGHRPEMDLKTMRVLGKSPNFAGLEELDMGRTSFSLKSWDEMLKWPWLSHLKWLRLHYARHVNPPSLMTVAEIQNLPKYRNAFEQKVAKVDWDTPFISPWDGTTCWKGLSWSGLAQQHLFSMWPYVERRDYEGLESAFRADCCKYVSDKAADAIDALPFKKYQQSLAVGLKQAIAACGRRRKATSIYLRIRTDLQWNGSFQVSDETVTEAFSPCEEYSYATAIVEYDAPSFVKAAEVGEKFSEYRPLDPGGVSHYLLARTVAAFGRCLAKNESPVPVFFSCVHAVFRM